jgi:replicative DNA helicase
MMETREAPNNIEAEQAYLGALFLNNEVLYRAEFQTGGHFYEPLHRRIFDTASELIRMGKVANPVTVKQFLPADEKLGDMTVGQYLVRLVTEAVNVILAADYARTIVDLATRRRLISIGETMIDAAYDAPVDVSPAAIGDKASDDIAEACTGNQDTLGAVSFDDAMTAAIDTASVAYSQDGQKNGGIPYRVQPLERLIGPLFGGQLIILGGATKQGKSALVGQIAIGAALEGYPVDFYSGEMTPQELAMREISRRIGVPVKKQKRGELTEKQFEQMMEVRTALKNTPIMIQDKRLTLPQLKDRWRRMVRKRGKSVLILDHIGLLDRDKATSRMSSWEFGEEVTRELKATARDLDCPVIACAQLKKNTFADNTKGPITERTLDQIIQRKPRYADLIGAVERDSDHVIIPFRPEVFLLEQEPTPGSDLYGVWECKVNEWRGKAQIVLALSREMHWPSSVNVGWDGASTTFFEIGGAGEMDALPDRFAENPMRLF